jgi:hypothetical protein
MVPAPTTVIRLKRWSTSAGVVSGVVISSFLPQRVGQVVEYRGQGLLGQPATDADRRQPASNQRC